MDFLASPAGFDLRSRKGLACGDVLIDVEKTTFWLENKAAPHNTVLYLKTQKGIWPPAAESAITARTTPKARESRCLLRAFSKKNWRT